jgi:polyhydroxyalkanoate synthase
MGMSAHKASDHHDTTDAALFAENLAKAAEKYQEFVSLLMDKQQHLARHSSGSIDPLHVSETFTDMWISMLGKPEKCAEHTITLAERYTNLLSNVTLRMLGDEAEPLYTPEQRDKRFQDPAWTTNPFYDFVKQSYLLNARWVEEVVKDTANLSPKEARKLDFYTRQWLDALSPTNFVLTNPVAMKEALETNGESLVRGLENLIHDLNISESGFTITTSDMKAFGVGKNLAMTPGKVIFQNDLMQLIQYSPTTEQAHANPVLIIPAWINRYYILDLQAENSLVRWMVEKGYTVFMISWVNPTQQHRNKAFEDYLLEGPIAALDAIERATGAKQVAAMGYCLGGTLLSITLAYLKAKKQSDRIASATFLTTLTDFEESGELGVFIDEAQLALVEARMEHDGYFDGADMSAIFSILRANDLIWSFVVNNYLLGKSPFPFDILYWNSDATRLPLKTHSFYLRNMYLENNLVKPKKLVFDGVPIDLTTVDTPCYFLSAREDHIAPWASTFTITKRFSGPLTFVLSMSGHVAGVVNPPAKQKYGYWTNSNTALPADRWLEQATQHDGSWWIHWDRWQRDYAGALVPAPRPGEGEMPIIEAAPGRYAKAI